MATDDDLEPFESPLLLIDSAKQNIKKFEAQREPFIKSCTYIVAEHFDPKTGENVLRLRFSVRLPSNLRVLTSSVFNDLRHSLDQAVCDGAILLGATNAKGKYFPFARDSAEFPAAVKKRCVGVHPDLVKFIERLKPYYGGDDLLWALNSISGKNKHQRIINLSVRNKVSGLYIRVARGPARIRTNCWNEKRNELEIARVGPGGDVDMNLGTTAEIVMGSVDVVSGQPALSVLNELVCKCDGIVLGIKAEAERLAGTT